MYRPLWSCLLTLCDVSETGTPGVNRSERICGGRLAVEALPRRRGTELCGRDGRNCSVPLWERDIDWKRCDLHEVWLRERGVDGVFAQLLVVDDEVFDHAFEEVAQIQVVAVAALGAGAKEQFIVVGGDALGELQR